MNAQKLIQRSSRRLAVPGAFHVWRGKSPSQRDSMRPAACHNCQPATLYQPYYQISTSNLPNISELQGKDYFVEVGALESGPRKRQ